MNREEVQLLGFEIVAYAGDARSKLLEALNAANEGDFEKAEQLTEEANECIANAHKAQTNLLAQEAQGNDSRTRPFNDNVIIKRFNEAFN